MRNAIEAGWLLAAALIPLAVTHEDFMLGATEMPKVFVLRTTALYLVVMVTLEWALSGPRTTKEEGALPGRLWGALLHHPARLVYFGAGAVVVASLVSVAFAPVKSIAIWGIDPGWDTYALFNLASYLVLFAVVATHLRTGAQLRRLVWVLTATSIVIGLYAFGQRFGFDPLKNDPAPALRPGSTFGNPIPVSSYLLMTLPLTVALFMSYRDRMSALTHIWIGAALIALQATAIVFSLARGTWLGVGVAEIAFVILLAWVVGPRHVVRRLAIAVVAGAVTVVMIALPVVGSASPAGAAVVERFGTIAPAIGGGLNNRFTIWTTAKDVYLKVPWVDTERFPEIPDLGFRPLRPIVGYGPDMFGYAYPLAGESTYTSELAGHGHNFFVHTALELGLLGVMAYAGLIGAVGWSLYRMLRAARGGRHPTWFAYVLVGLASVFFGRIVEQITGRAQVSDLTLSWMLAAVVVAMSVMRPDQEQEVPAARAPRPRRRPRARVNGLRLGAAAAVASAVLVLWLPAVFAHANAAITAADARSAGQAGQGERAFDLLTEARDLAPSASTIHLGLGQGLLDAGSRQEDPEQKAGLLEQAYQEAQAVLERNPLNQRAWQLAGEVQRELARVRPERTDEAIHDNQVRVALLPGFWQARAGLAWAYVELELFEDGLAAVAVAKELAVSGSAGSAAHFVHYLEALALQGLGRRAEAIAAAQRSMAARPNTAAEALLQELTGQSSS